MCICYTKFDLFFIKKHEKRAVIHLSNYKLKSYKSPKNRAFERFVKTKKRAVINSLFVGWNEWKRAECSQWEKKRRRFSVRMGEFERASEKTTTFEQRRESEYSERSEPPTPTL